MKKEDRKIWLFALLLIVSTLFILLTIIKQSRDKNNIWKSYDEFNYADVFLNATLVNDRTIYWSLEDIISDFVSSYTIEEVYNSETESSITYEDYYNALSENYRKFLGKERYLEVSSSFLKKFMIENEYEGASMESSGLIDSVYSVEENVYLCNLTSKIKESSGYIVIGLNPEEKSFSIMYME